MPFLLFVLGASVGSFLNVVSLRYNPDKFLFGRSLLGRSRCPHCGRTLHWFELVPVLSFILQLGRCRHCRAALSLEYPITEILSGLIFVFIPTRLKSPYFILNLYSMFSVISALWILVFVALLLVALIDIRLSIIPDELNIALLVLGIILIFTSQPGFGLAGGSFLESFAPLFGFRENIWVNHVLGALVAGLFFLGLIFITRGRGIGMGDLKLAVPLGLIFGWPDTIFIVGVAFVIGSLFGAYIMLFQGKTLKSYLPLGPFLVGSAAIIFFFGQQLMRFYLGLFGL